MFVKEEDNITIVLSELLNIINVRSEEQGVLTIRPRLMCYPHVIGSKFLIRKFSKQNNLLIKEDYDIPNTMRLIVQ